MSELFNIPESKSPRLKWMEKHDVKTEYCKSIPEAPWSAWTGDLLEAIETDALGTGLAELDAIVDMATELGLKLWNEE